METVPLEDLNVREKRLDSGENVLQKTATFLLIPAAYPRAQLKSGLSPHKPYIGKQPPLYYSSQTDRHTDRVAENFVDHLTVKLSAYTSQQMQNYTFKLATRENRYKRSLAWLQLWVDGWMVGYPCIGSV